MADEKLSLHIDSDWKKQAQEEKRKLAEQEQKSAPAKAIVQPEEPAPAASASSAGRTVATGAARAAKGQKREIPPASFATLVESLLTQALYAMMEVQSRGADAATGLDLAKHHIDSLAVLEEKTKNNLTEEERRLLDSSLYQARMQYVQLASRYSM